jgi:hypothetical protein
VGSEGRRSGEDEKERKGQASRSDVDYSGKKVAEEPSYTALRVAIFLSKKLLPQLF